MDNNCNMLLVKRLYEFNNHIYWNEKNITLEDIIKGIESNILEENNEYGNGDGDFLKTKQKSDKWHIGRVIHFIHHPEEIKNINVDNYCNGMIITPIPIVTDGNHRLLAAVYLGLDRISCNYGGRSDVLNYLNGESDIPPLE